MTPQSTNITLNVTKNKRAASTKFLVAREYLEELRDLINDYLEMEKKVNCENKFNIC